MSRDRYVVRDEHGQLYVAYDCDVDDPCPAADDAKIEERKGHGARLSLPDALRLKATCIEEFGGLFKIYKLKRKAKPRPRAPRGLFATINGCDEVTQADPCRAKLHVVPGERVFRYVLAEGEK